ncbi:ThuA domain-containing protein [Porifericola rhodea]|uniref:ThuA domain-containing protein n=1 Tax=Porifericola rhodea TaxID=930972 RepID=UPI002665CE4E|nr:ThuA domain-containing protein [Porifericola rhodea]WKN30416.1 ThuA domain-containing protein [Porifericola rhodea]
MFKKVLKLSLLILLALICLAALGVGAFVYKARYGFNFYETKPPTLPAKLEQPSLLLFSKTNGFRHGEAIEASIPAIQAIAKENNWFVFTTDNGAVFNETDLAKFEVVIWNNVSGKVLNPEQRTSFRQYLESGGGFVGIHAAGDNSHQWEWYENEVIGAHFSHHPLNPQIQEAVLSLEKSQDNQSLRQHLPDQWKHADEWYMFFDNPKANGCQVLYALDESNIVTSGNISFMVTDKDWGMGNDHPIAWYKTVGEGKAFYSALGHHAEVFQTKQHHQMMENAIRWAGDI